MPLLLQGRILEDVQRLDLDTLEWALPPRVGAQPQGGLRGAGHTLAGLCAFGGCMPTVVGVLPVKRTDVLLLGAAHQQPQPARISKRTCFTWPLCTIPVAACSCHMAFCRLRTLACSRCVGPAVLT